MDRILSLIDNTAVALARYLDNLDSLDEYAVIEKKYRVDGACATLRGKFEMLAHCVGTLCLLEKRSPIKDECHSIELLLGETETQTILCYVDPLHRDNVICNFCNMLTLSASLRDAVVRLIGESYGERIAIEFDDDRRLDPDNLTSLKLAEILGDKCALGISIQTYLAGSLGYKKIIELRDELVHRSIVDVLLWDYVNPRSIPKIESHWTPAGENMAVPKYARFVYGESVRLIREICGCIASNPAKCIEKI